MSSVWYEEVPASEKLMQGDLILSCPVATWDADTLHTQGQSEEEFLRTAIKAIRADVVVMTQACDLKQGNVTKVTLCPHLTLDKYRPLWEAKLLSGNQNPTEKAWKTTCNDLKDGLIWNHSLLNNGETESLHIEHRVVDFHDVYTLPRQFLESLLVQRGLPRLRLLPPYREHLSQAFARFYMRVGLPDPIDKAW
jgi:hypothetical protein